MWMRANGSTRRTSPYKVELLLGDDQRDQHFIDIEEETLLTQKIQYQARGAYIASLQDVEDPA
eukprot:12177251-Prorocentrum_lima.AAC.1